jgi:hypothetical protein
MTTYGNINSLDEISFIGGTYYILEYKVYDQDGGAANISGSTCSVKISPYGESNIVVLTYSGTITGTNTFEIYLLSADTIGLSGKFKHQPIILDSGKSYRSQQGIINIVSAII